MDTNNEKPIESKQCFVIMPISDVDGYETGHFKRVYDYIIKPACVAAGYTPVRADDVQVTNYIVLDILKKIIYAEMVICDISGTNPNVLYELGLRHAFNLPVTLIKDSRTPRVFDIQGLRDIEYDASLRIDTVESAKTALESTLKNTSGLKQTDVNSIVQLLGVRAASLPNIEISPDTHLLLEAISDIGERMSRLEDFRLRTESPIEYAMKRPKRFRYIDKNNTLIKEGSKIRHPEQGDGEVVMIDVNAICVLFGERGIYIYTPQDAAKDLEVIVGTSSI